MRRKTSSLAEQFLTGPTYRGYEVAIHHGLLHLVLDYQDELLRWEKGTTRLKASKDGEDELETGEDADFEHHYQRLPLQKEWLTQQGYVPAKLFQDAWIKTVTACILKLQQAVLQHLPQSSEWSASEDELYIGTAAVLLQKSAYVSRIFRPEKRLKTKTSFASQQYVLSVLALASWIRLTEEWHDGPCDSMQRLACVSNQGAMHLRQLGLPVHRECVQSLSLIHI